MVKDYSGGDNKVLQKYYRLNSRNKISIHPDYLSNENSLQRDLQSLVSKLHNKDYIIINGKPLMKIISGSDRWEYGLICEKSAINKIGIQNSRIIFIRNTVIRNVNERESIINKISNMLKIIN